MKLRVALAQRNATVGDLEGNARLIVESVTAASEQRADLVVFPEMFLTGYPPEDLLFKKAFLQKQNKWLQKGFGPGPSILFGFAHNDNSGLFNAAGFFAKNKLQTITHKQALPNYGVFDEKRYFQQGSSFKIVMVNGFRIAITICEDIWMGPAFLKPLKKANLDLVINMSASPFHAEKIKTRHTVICAAAQFLKTPVLYCNLVGGQDELVFDGGSFVCDGEGRVVVQGPLFKETLLYVDFERKKPNKIWIGATPLVTPASKIEQVYEALLLGLRDYVNKNGFKKVALGISGGIDSALVAALAVKALGAERVTGVTMPSRFSSADTLGDSHRLAKNLKIALHEIAIEPMVTQFLAALNPLFHGRERDVTEENLQARVRGVLLMALSNKFGWLILTTGNKSETSTGYCTLYGDTAGGFAVLKDVLKTTVYELCRFINRKEGFEFIPASIIDRPPTAELRANQKDEDSLGPYAALDPVIVSYVENNKSVQDMKRGLKQEDAYLRRIVRLIDANEYKRRQAPPGIKITPRSFGRDYRMPLTNRFRDE